MLAVWYVPCLKKNSREIIAAFILHFVAELNKALFCFIYRSRWHFVSFQCWHQPILSQKYTGWVNILIMFHGFMLYETVIVCKQFWKTKWFWTSDYMRHHLQIEENQIAEMCVGLYKEYGTTMAGLKVQLISVICSLVGWQIEYLKWPVLHFLLLSSHDIAILCRH